MTFGPAVAASQGLVPTPSFVLDTHGCLHLGLHHSNLSLPPWEDCEFWNVLRSGPFSRHCDLVTHWPRGWLSCQPLLQAAHCPMLALLPDAVQSPSRAFALAVTDRKHRMHSTEG